MKLKSLGSSVHHQLVEEMKSVKFRNESSFPYYIFDKGWAGTHENDYEESYMIAWSLDKDGDQIVSKVYYKVIHDTFKGKIMLEAQLRRSRIAESKRAARKSKHSDWSFSDRDDWKYEKYFIIEANVITLMMLLGMSSNDCHDIIVEEVLKS
jgi:hypothetical protein